MKKHPTQLIVTATLLLWPIAAGPVAAREPALREIVSHARELRLPAGDGKIRTKALGDKGATATTTRDISPKAGASSTEHTATGRGDKDGASKLDRAGANVDGAEDALEKSDRSLPERCIEIVMADNRA